METRDMKKYSIKYFVKNGIDAFFLGTNTLGRSAFNRAERRIVKLSNELSGFIHKLGKFGRHLDGKGLTVDRGLQLKNFECARHTLSEI